MHLHSNWPRSGSLKGTAPVSDFDTKKQLVTPAMHQTWASKGSKDRDMEMGDMKLGSSQTGSEVHLQREIPRPPTNKGSNQPTRAPTNQQGLQPTNHPSMDLSLPFGFLNSSARMCLKERGTPCWPFPDSCPSKQSKGGLPPFKPYA